MSLLRQEERFFSPINMEEKETKVKTVIEAIIFKTVTSV